MEDEERTIETPSTSSGLGSTNELDTSNDAAMLTSGQPVVPNRKRRHRALSAAAVAMVLVISLVVIGAGGPGSKEAAAEVILGARTTLAKNSVDLTLSGSLTANGQTVPISGSGFADSATNLESMTLNFIDENEPAQESMLMDDGNAYMQISLNNQNQISRYLPGKLWVELPIGATQSSGLGASAPNILNYLQLLTQEGNTVVPLGDSTINGETVGGFQVTITKQAMNAELKRVEAQGGVVAQAVERGLKVLSLNPPVLKLWLNSDHLLVREEELISASIGGVGASGDVVVNFSNYGSKSTISAPDAGTVATYEAFLAAAQAPGLH